MNKHEKINLRQLFIHTGLVIAIVQLVVHCILKMIPNLPGIIADVIDPFLLFIISPILIYTFVLKKKIEPYLKKSLELEAYFKALDNGAIISKTDKFGKITYINDNFSKISGYSKEEVLGKTHNILNSKYHSPDFFKNMWETILSGNVWRGVIKNQKKSGGFYWVYSIIAPIFDQNNEIVKYISIRYDITKEKENKEKLELERAKSIQESKLASLGEISAGIAHEINNPLAVISGNIEILKSSLSGKELSRLDKIESSISKIQKIIRGLKRFVHSSDGEKKSVQINKLIEESISLAEMKFKKFDINVSLSLSEEDLKIKGNETEIEQVIINLVNNSVDAIKTFNDRWINVKTFSRGDKVIIELTDSGNGIPLATQDRLFQPFFTTKEVGEGTGLGLSISKNIIEDHGGLLNLINERKNTTFELIMEKINE